MKSKLLLIFVLTFLIFTFASNENQLAPQIKSLLIKQHPKIANSQIIINFDHARISPYEKEYDFILEKSRNYQLKPKQTILFKLINKKTKAEKKLYLPIDLKIFAKVAYSSQKINRAESFNKDNIEFITQNLTLLPNFYTSLDELKGLEVKFNLAKGRVINHSMVKETPLIRLGDTVNIIYQDQNIIVSAKGVARSEGFLNQKIRVQNIDTRKYLFAKVINHDSVVVSLD